MKKIINYEKDILFKTNIGSLTSISLEHDFTLGDGVLKGDFLVSGEYKPNELSMNKESFEYRLPLEYVLDDTVDIDSLSYDIDDFEYSVKDDCLTVYIDFAVRYEEKKIEPIIPSITEDELNFEKDAIELPKLADAIDENSQRETETDLENESPTDRAKEDDAILSEPIVEEVGEETARLDDADQDTIVETLVESEEYVTYHVHIVRSGDTLESIAEKYGCTIELIKEYNDFDTLEEKLKLLIPEVQDE